MKRTQFVKALLALSIFFYVMSLAFVVFHTAGGPAYGVFALIFGFIGLFIEFQNLLLVLKQIWNTGFADYSVLTGSCYSWLANIMVPFAWITAKYRPILSRYFAIAAIALMLSFLFADVTLTGGGGGSKERITGLGIGYYFWLSSGLLILLASIGQVKLPEEF